MEYSEEEDVNTQRFDVTIVWPAETEEKLTENEIRDAIEALAKDVSEDAVVEVEEIIEPAY